MTLTSKRKHELESLAHLYYSEFKLENQLPDLKGVATSEDVLVIQDDYKNSFEGLTICEDGRFFIHINSNSISGSNKARKRFTLAHELGHALINEHRKGLLSGYLEPHISSYLVENSNKLIELEADYFASCLLMPRELIVKYSKEYTDSFSFNFFDYLSDRLQTSITATILRYSGITDRPIFVNFCNDGNVSWYRKGSHFPNWTFNFEVKGEVPTGSLLSNVIDDTSIGGEIREVNPSVWFKTEFEEDSEITLFEQIKHIQRSDTFISLLWLE